MKRTFLLYALAAVCCLCLPVAAQERQYTITETELTQLERISESLAISKQNQQLQANSLTERLRAQERQAKALAVSLQQAEQKAKALNSQLQTERVSLKDLRTSYNKSEQEAAKTIAEKQALIDEQKDKLHRRMIAVIILSTVLAGFIVFAIVKLKRFFPFLP
nr:MAG TPA: type I restriction enzyme R protein [Bacteriophage sp.]